MSTKQDELIQKLLHEKWEQERREMLRDIGKNSTSIKAMNNFLVEKLHKSDKDIKAFIKAELKEFELNLHVKKINIIRTIVIVSVPVVAIIAIIGVLVHLEFTDLEAKIAKNKSNNTATFRNLEKFKSKSIKR